MQAEATSIAERASGLARRIDEYEEARQDLEQIEKFRARLEQLETLLGRLTEPLRAVEALSERSALELSIGNRIYGLCSQLELVTTQFREEKQDFLDGKKSSLVSFQRATEALLDDLLSQVTEAWEVYVERVAQPLDAEVVRVLSSIPDFSAESDTLQEKERELRELRSTLPTPEVVTRLETLASERQELWDNMHGSGFSEEVLQFLRAASAEGAEVTALSDAVLSWLSANDLMGSFRIHMANRDAK